MAFVLLSCGDSDGAERVAAELVFEATVASEPFSCAGSYSNLGTSESTAEIQDFRFYVHDIEVVDGDGNAAAVELVEDGRWQRKEVALIDFTDGTGNCSNTPGESNDRVQLRVPDGDWQGIRFRLGVPFEVNHIDMSTAASPLNIAGMFWSWTGGYKFLRLDIPTEHNPTYRFHLGSMQCQPAAGGGASHCDYPNRPQVVVEEFRLDENHLRIDLAELLRDVDMDHHTENTPHGCMSTVDDPDCDGLFDVLGLLEPDGFAASTLFTSVPSDAQRE